MSDLKANLEILTRDYLPAFLAFGIKNTRDLHDAEELAQEIGNINEADYPWASGKTSTQLDECTVWPQYFSILGNLHRQYELRDAKKAQALYDTYTGQANDSNIEVYAQLISEGYVVKNSGQLYCNMAVITPTAKKLMANINAELTQTLAPLCSILQENIARIVKTTLPEQLRLYTTTYTNTWLSAFANALFMEALYNRGFITLPEAGDLTPVACYIDEH